MPWLWTEKAPKCEASPSSEMAIASEEWARQVLRTAVNSSNQRPTFSHWHNIGLATSSSANLLSLPLNLRNKILRLAIVDSEPILVAADYPEECKEPGLLQVCHAIREEARPMFYKENTFSVQIQDFNIQAVLPWLERTEEFHVGKVLREEEMQVEGVQVNEEKTAEAKEEDAVVPAGPRSYADIMMEIDGGSSIPVPQRTTSRIPQQITEVKIAFTESYQRFLDYGVSEAQKAMLDKMAARYLSITLKEDAARIGGLYYDEPYQPHWVNLVAWLKLFHDGKVGRYEGNGADQELGVSGLFDVMECFKERGLDWATIEAFLTGHRKMLAGSDEEWLVDH